MKLKWIATSAIVLSAMLSSSSFAATSSVEMTWMSIANWYFKIGDKRILMDAYITRIPESTFYSPAALPNDRYAYTKSAFGVDLPSITKVRDAVFGEKKLDYLLTGHSHFDHSWDTPTWSKITKAHLLAAHRPVCKQLRKGSPANSAKVYPVVKRLFSVTA